MTLQHIRRYYEQPIVDWCADNGVELRVDNMLEPGGDAASEFVVTRLNFGEMTEPSMCGLLENIRGSLVVEFFGPKGRGPARAQEVMQELMCELMALTARPAARDANGVLGTLGPIVGPLFTALDEKPYFFATMSMPINASLDSRVAGRITTRQVGLTNPDEILVTTQEVDLVALAGTMRTQEDANKYFAERIEKLEQAHDDNMGHDSESY